MQPCTLAQIYALYRQSPTKIISRVLDFVTSESAPNLPTDIRNLVDKMQAFQAMLEDYNQAVTLQGLGKGVDVVRFADDHDYKTETILGLAMTTEDQVYQIALSLARRYSLPLWHVYMCHLEFLFSDSGWSIEEIKVGKW